MPRSHDDARLAQIATPTADARRTAAIRQCNDRLRTSFAGGLVMITSGVRALAADHFAIVMRRVGGFTAFTPDNDPHGEHDFGAVEVAGLSVFWKIDAYDKRLEYGSPDPADAAVTTRVLTIMLAEEY